MDSIIRAIDAELSRLQQVRSLLAQNSGSPAVISKRGRKPKTAVPAKKAAVKRVLSPEARKRIADAQKKRWAAAKTAATNSAAIKDPAKKSGKNSSKKATKPAAKFSATAPPSTAQ